MSKELNYMGYISKNELERNFKASNIPVYYAAEIIKHHGNEDGMINEDLAWEIERELEKAFKIDNKYKPKTIFEDTFFTPDELTDYIDRQFHYIKNKYIPLGLKLPFPSLENAYIWLKKESLEGILNTERIQCPALDGRYIGGMITMPYRTRLSDKGVIIKDEVICNYSSFLLELNSTINTLKAITGIDEISILNYFLCGKDIEFPRIKITKADAFNQYFIVQVNTNDVTKTEWDEIYKLYRENTNRKHKKQLSEDNIKLAKILDTIEVPKKPNAEFFRKLIVRWNDETGDNMNINNWRTMRRRYETLEERKKNMSTFHRSILKLIEKFKENKKEDERDGIN